MAQSDEGGLGLAFGSRRKPGASQQPIRPFPVTGQSDEGGMAFGRPMVAPPQQQITSPYDRPLNIPTLWSGAAPVPIEYTDVEQPLKFGSADEVRRAAQGMRTAGQGLTGQARAEAIERARPRGALQRVAKNLRGYDPSTGMQQKGNIQYTTVNEAMQKAAPLPFGAVGMGGQQDWGIEEQLAARDKWLRRGAEARPELLKQREAIPVWQQLQNLKSQGVAYKNPQGGSEAQMDNIVRELSRWGISDLGQVGTTTDANGKQVIFNRMTGQQLPETIGSGSTGEGFTEYKWMPLPNGGAIPVSKWEESSDRGKIAQALALGAGLLAPMALGPLAGVLGGTAAGVAPSIGASIGAGALYGGATAALPAAITGGNMGKALLGGALGGAIGQGVQAFNPAGAMGIQNAVAQNALNQAISGGLRGGVQAGIQGQNLGQGALGGALAGGIGGAIAPAFGKGALGQMAAQQVTKPLVRGAKKFFGMEGQG